MNFTIKELEYIQSNFKKTTSKELFKMLVSDFDFHYCYTSFRSALYANGFHKVNMRRWSRAETSFLLENYGRVGNVEIAKKLSKDKRTFTRWQVQKKLSLLNIKRTPEQLLVILERNKRNGVYREGAKKTWTTIRSKYVQAI